MTVEKVTFIKERLKAAQNQQKIWANMKRRPLEFEMGEKSYVKISPLKGLRKYIPDPTHVLEIEPLAIEGNLNEELMYEEVPIRIVDTNDQVLRRRTILYVKVQWSNHSKREAMWELKEKMRKQYPYLFEGKFN
ncbi:uncharacterized protein [Henckelia pumila]|uniref:uncharacterized protein n=1 Tax=Henckelia pumila TaxID=405737 RepID=UPI003C6E78F5